jgi:hypothetical protein
MRRDLADDGASGFAVFLCKAFIRALGCTGDARDRYIVGFCNTDLL